MQASLNVELQTKGCWCSSDSYDFQMEIPIPESISDDVGGREPGKSNKL